MIIAIMGVTLGYFMGFTLLRNTIIADHEKMALILSNQVSQMIGDEVHEIHTYLTESIFKDKMKESNAQYQGMKEEAIRGNLMAMDNKWIETSDDSLLMQEYLENSASLSLEAGVHFMQKPFSNRDLAVKVREALEGTGGRDKARPSNGWPDRATNQGFKVHDIYKADRGGFTMSHPFQKKSGKRPKFL
jgi:hypothetical protein